MLRGMEILDQHHDAIDLQSMPLHLGLGSRARPIAGFAFDPTVLQAYSTAVAGDGPEGRLVVLIDEEGPGDHWERHPGGDEVIVCLDGHVTVVRETDDGVSEIRLGPGKGTVNPAGVWHAVDADGRARLLTITPGLGSEHRPR